MSQEKRFKKGEMLFKEGDTLSTIYVLQSGKVSLYIERGGQKTEVDQPMPGHVIGEQGVFGFPKQAYNAEAQSEVKVVELPLDPIKMVFDKSPAPYKIFVKGLGDELRRLRGLLKGIKLETEAVACPPRFIPRLCAILVLVAKTIGQKPKVDASVPSYKRDEEKKANPHFKDDDIILPFSTLKIYAARMFLESPVRMQAFCELLFKLGYLTPKYEHNEDTEQDELVELRIHDVRTVELFGEFYQHNLFKAGKSEMIIVDKVATQIAGAFTMMALPVETDRNGVVKLEYSKVLEELKAKFYIDLKDTHILLLEKKGLYMKRASVDGKVMVSFDKYEWSSTWRFWQIIREIDRWNEQGRVDVKENLNEYRPAGPEKCPGCQNVIEAKVNFCPNCGHKVGAAAAA